MKKSLDIVKKADQSAPSLHPEVRDAQPTPTSSEASRATEPETANADRTMDSSASNIPARTVAEDKVSDDKPAIPLGVIIAILVVVALIVGYVSYLYFSV